MKTILYNPIFINPQAYYVFPRLTRWLRPDDSYKEPANYIGQIEVTIIAYGEIGYTEYFEHTNYIDFTNFSNSYVRISLFTRLGSCVLGEWKIGAMEGDRPYIEPEVLASLKAVVIVGDKTNQDKDRDTVANLVDASNPFIISNAAFKLNSGFGKYEITFQYFPYTENITTVSDSKVVFGIGGQLLIPYPAMTENIPSFKIKVSGLSGTYRFRYYYRSSDGVQHSIDMAQDGYYELPICYNVQSSSDGTNCGFANNGNDVVTITQIPSFEGAFVTDGVDDLITSTKTVQEMLGGSNEITVVSMIHQVADRGSTYPNIYNNQIRYSTRLLRSTVTAANVVGKTGIYGYTATGVSITGTPTGKVVNDILGDKNDYPYLASAFTGIDAESHFSVEGYLSDSNNIIETSSVAWYWTVISNKVLTTDQINQVIAYYDLDKYLEPTVLYNVKRQGLSNDTPASEWYLKDYSKNGYDMTLNNFSKAGGSGIAAKQGESIKDYSIIKDEEYQELTIYNEFKFKIKSKLSGRYWTVQYINRTNTSYPVTIVIDKDAYWVNSTTYYDADNNKQVIRKDIPIAADTPIDVLCCGYDQFDIPEDATSIVSAVSYINYNAVGEITVELIPSCEGGLITDGVNDFGKVTGLPAYKDYTTIIDYQRFDIGYIEGKGTTGILSKAHAAGQGAFLMNLIGSTGTHMNSYSFGTANANTYTDLDRQIYYQTKYKMQGFDMTAGTGVDGDSMWLALVRDNDSRFFNGAIYSLMSFPYSMSEFLIERQLKKHKLGTLYPNMMEFRPIIKSNIDTLKINYWDKDWNVVNVGDYVSVGNDIKTNITVPNGYKVSKVTSDAFDNITIEKSSTDFIYDVKFYGIKKSPQKITMTIEQDENYVKFEPVITSNVEYVRLDFYLNNYQKRINIGDYIPKDAYLRANLYLKNNVDELTVFTFNGVNIGYRRSSVDDTAFNINQIYNYDSPQEVNITIDEYIRYEDIVQPYPVLLRFNDENGNEVSWGGKFRVGSTITRIGSAADSNLLPNIYNIFGLLLNGNQVTSYKAIVEKTMVFKAKSAYIFDNNEPNCILSPRLLRIPNSSYKILGYIPDISGHGNNGKINNSAYAEGSGVNEDGSYQLDGVDDFVTIPTLSSGGKQMLMKVNWDKTIADAILYDQRGYPNEFAIYNADVDNNNNPVFAYQARNNGQTYIDGILNKNIKASELRAITHNITITNELSTGTNTSSPVIGSNRVRDAYFTKMALYDFMLFDNISTDDKILELNEYVGIEGNTE